MAAFSSPHLLLIVLFLTNGVLSDHSPAHSPTLPPPSPADDAPPSPPTPAPASSPAPGPSFSPPAPPPPPLGSDLPPTSHSPADLPNTPPSPSPSPAPSDVGDLPHENQPNASDLKSSVRSSDSNRMSGGQKAGVVIGVIAGACVVGVGAFVYKKRRQNIQRSNYGYAARRELL